MKKNLFCLAGIIKLSKVKVLHHILYASQANCGIMYDFAISDAILFYFLTAPLWELMKKKSLTQQ